MEFLSPWLLTVSSFLVSILFIVHKLVRRHLENGFRLPPGPLQLPIIGNLHQLAAKNLPPHQRLEELAKVYGPIMYLRLGEISTVVVSSAELAKEVLKGHDMNLANRPKVIAAETVFYHSDIAFAPYGEYWRQVRKIATLELLSSKRVQSFRHVREQEVSKLVMCLTSEIGSVVNLSEKIFSLLFNITSRVVFNKEGEGQGGFRVFLSNLVDVLSGFYIADLYPSIKWLDSISGLRRKLEEMVKESDKIIEPIIEEHMLSKKKQGKIEDEDFVDVLLNFHKDNFDGDAHLSFSLTTNNIKAIILEIFCSGNETSFTVIEWAMSELLKNPKLMEMAQAEVRKVYQGKGTVDESNLNELKFLKLVIKETLRLHFILPLIVPRESIEHCQILGYDIPPKTRVLINAWAIARDPKYWVDPDLFKPERFEKSSIDYKGTNFEFIPFGAGRRMCPGMTLGMVHVEFLLAMLLYHFDWKFPDGLKPEDLDMDEVCGITVRRKNQLRVIPIPYSASSSTM